MRTANANWFSILVILIALATGLTQGCGANPSDATPKDVGSVALAVDAGGTTLTELRYYISSDSNPFRTNGVIDITNSVGISALIGGIPAGNYYVTLTASGAGLSCIGGNGDTEGVDVYANYTSSVTIELHCTKAGTTGSVMISGVVNVCPSLESLSILPLETTVGHSVDLIASVTDDHAPNPELTYAWTASAGTLTGADSPNASLTCEFSANVTVTLTVTDGDYLCDQTATQIVSCRATEDDPATPGDDRPGYVICRPVDEIDYVCGPGTYCCWTTPTCGGLSQSCSDWPPWGHQSCDGPEDCPGDSGCWDNHRSIGCGYGGNSDNAICHRDSDCTPIDSGWVCGESARCGRPAAQSAGN